MKDFPVTLTEGAKRALTIYGATEEELIIQTKAEIIEFNSMDEDEDEDDDYDYIENMMFMSIMLKGDFDKLFVARPDGDGGVIVDSGEFQEVSTFKEGPFKGMKLMLPAYDDDDEDI